MMTAVQKVKFKMVTIAQENRQFANQNAVTEFW